MTIYCIVGAYSTSHNVHTDADIRCMYMYLSVSCSPEPLCSKEPYCRRPARRGSRAGPEVYFTGNISLSPSLLSEPQPLIAYSEKLVYFSSTAGYCYVNSGTWYNRLTTDYRMHRPAGSYLNLPHHQRTRSSL